MWRPYLLMILCRFGFYVDAITVTPPVITKQPKADGILFDVATRYDEDDTPFFIECEAEGEPEPNYRWTKNGKLFHLDLHDHRMTRQPGRGTLVITQPRDEDAGQYQCFATNQFGTATSNSVFVRKSELNSFKNVRLENITAIEGEPLRLQCQPPDGWPTPIVHWMKLSVGTGELQRINNSRMTLDPEGNLWMSNVTSLDSSSSPDGNNFYYICTAQSPIRNELKLGNRVLLDVVQASDLNRFPVTLQYVSRTYQVALVGRRLELFCIFGGTPLPQVVWTKNGSPIQWSDRVVQGHYGKSLTIDPIQSIDEAVYTCEASNGVGPAQTYSLDVIVFILPFFTNEPEHFTAAEEEDAAFHCEALGYPKPIIQWIFNGRPIEEDPVNNRRVVTNNSITIKDLIRSDTGNYGCNASNNLGYVYRDVYLNVLAVPPEIEKPPGIEATVHNRNITLVCKVFGVPKPEVKWIKNGLVLSGGRFKVTLDGNLEISNVTFTDAGDYQCSAINKFGNTNANGTVIVKTATYIIDRPENYEVVADETVTFRCSAVADINLELTIDWLKNGELIDYTDTRFTKMHDNSLQILHTTRLDSGKYTCVADTELDRVEATAMLIVQTVPNAPKLIKIECFENSATVSWVPHDDNHAPILYYTIQYNITFTPDHWGVAYVKVPSSEHKYTIEISPLANYTFKVNAWNKFGKSLTLDRSEVCTAQEVVPYMKPTEAPENFTVIEVTGSEEAWLGWIDVSNEKRYKIRVWAGDEQEEEIREISFKATSNPKLIKNLIPNTKYYAQIMKNNGQYNGPVSNTISFTTLEGRPGPVHSLEALPLGSTSFWLTWKPPLEPNGEIIGYKIFYEDVHDTDVKRIHVLEPQISEARILSAKLTNLRLYRDYRVHVQAMTKAGAGYTHSIEVQTMGHSAMVPDSPKFTCEQVTGNTGAVRVKWLPAGPKPGVNFYVTYYNSHAYEWERTKVEFHNDYLVIRSLQPDLIYQIRVVAVDWDFSTTSASQFIDMNSNKGCVPFIFTE